MKTKEEFAKLFDGLKKRPNVSRHDNDTLDPVLYGIATDAWDKLGAEAASELLDDQYELGPDNTRYVMVEVHGCKVVLEQSYSHYLITIHIMSDADNKDEGESYDLTDISYIYSYELG